MMKSIITALLLTSSSAFAPTNMASMSPNFHLVRKIIEQEDLIEKRPGHKWVTGLSFDILRKHIASSFIGNPSAGIDGELFCRWMLNKYLTGTDENFKLDAMTFFLSFPLHHAMGSKKEFLDVSIQTTDGQIAATAILVDYKIESRLSQWWRYQSKKLDELYLTYKLSKQRALPDLVTDSKWEKQFHSVVEAVVNTTQTFQNIHTEKGPQKHHWYVNFIATSPSNQGQGYGSQIMNKVCNLADKERVDCYLECSSEKNKKFYEKFGFIDMGSHTLDNNALEETTIYSMIRQPKLTFV